MTSFMGLFLEFPFSYPLHLPMCPLQVDERHQSSDWLGPRFSKEARINPAASDVGTIWEPASMAVPVMEIGEVDVGVNQRCMPVEMPVRFARRPFVRMVVVCVVRVQVVVLGLFVGVVVLVALGQM